MNVTLFFRKKEIGFFSIEEVFENLIPHFSQASAKTCKAPCKRISPLNLAKNLIWAWHNNDSVNHITGDISYIALALSKNTILTVHDIGSLISGNSLTKWLKILFWIKWPAMRVKKITTISEFSKSELLRIIPDLKEKITVIHNPYNIKWTYLDTNIRRFDPLNINVLLVGTKPNKNLIRSIQAMKNGQFKLHILGHLTDEQTQLLEENQMSYTNYSELSSDEVVEFYKAGDILCFPSTYEGFGMPIIEAQILGIPVLTSDIGAMKEIALDSAHLVDPLDADQIRSGIFKIINDEDYRLSLIEKGKSNVKRFHPKRIAEQYCSLYLNV